VTGVVRGTPGAITYVDAAYSITNKLSFALVGNRAGKYTTPGLRGITQALSQLPAKVTRLSQLKIVDPPATAGKLAYPISTFTYVIVPTSSSKAAELRKFVYWAVTQGQKFGPPLFFVPLPKTVQAFAFREIKKVQGAQG
jgi:phosphate transport system substrate-binding protein